MSANEDEAIAAGRDHAPYASAGGYSSREEELYNAAEHILIAREQPIRLDQPSSSQILTGAASGSEISVRGTDSSGNLSSSPGIGSAGYDSDTEQSITSSVAHYVYEGGMRYHAYRDGRYAFPNDDHEQNREDMKHHMSLLLCRGAHFYAPISEKLEQGAEVLDLGTGTGIWSVELGDKYPNSRFTGIDLSPIQPNMVPDNVHFFVDDFEEDWVDPENKYDYVHIRHTLHSVKDRKALLQRALRHLKPGGYFEVQEMYYHPHCDDETLTPQVPYAIRDFLIYMDQGLRAMGSELHAILNMAEDMREAGFEDVTEVTHKCPLGIWPRDQRYRICGWFLRTITLDGLKGLTRRPFMALGWTPLQIEMFLVDVRRAAMETGIHCYYKYIAVHGRKPMGEGDEGRRIERPIPAASPRIEVKTSFPPVTNENGIQGPSRLGVPGMPGDTSITGVSMTDAESPEKESGA